jgi:hypothetical protein
LTLIQVSGFRRLREFLGDNTLAESDQRRNTVPGKKRSCLKLPGIGKSRAADALRNIDVAGHISS